MPSTKNDSKSVPTDAGHSKPILQNGFHKYMQIEKATMRGETKDLNKDRETIKNGKANQYSNKKNTHSVISTETGNGRIFNLRSIGNVLRKTEMSLRYPWEISGDNIKKKKKR